MPSRARASFLLHKTLHRFNEDVNNLTLKSNINTMFSQKIPPVVS